MADVKWIKLSTSIFDNRKIKQIECLPDGYAVIVAWIKLMCLAGTVNDSGLIYLTKEIPYTDQMLASQFGMPLTTVQLALKTFEQFGMVEVVDNLLLISNWEKYQSVDRLSEIREYNRLAQQRSREKRKELPPVNDKSMTSQRCHDTDIDKDKDKDKEKKKNIKNKKKIFSDDSSFNDAILSFIEFRKGIKKPMTERAVDLLISKLDGMADTTEEKIEILNQSIINGWQGVFPLKDQQNKPIKQTIYKNKSKAEELDEFYNMAADWAGSGEKQ